MRPEQRHLRKQGAAAPAAGTTLLEVLLAIVIFIVGMMALLHLQGNLTRSSTDANLRTVAANVAEELIEERRNFQRVATDPDGVEFAYQDIANEDFTVDRGGIQYSVDIDVEDWYFKPDKVSVTKDVGELPADQNTTISDFKHVTMNVSWEGSDFQTDDATGNRLGSGSITITEIIPAISPLGAAKVASEDDGQPGTPPVEYTPGLNPDIIAISLGDSKFKESTTPQPIVRRHDELIETWFDVITYNTLADESIFLRREEFIAISCACTLRDPSGALQAPDGTPADGRLPTLWTGAEYQEGALVAKPFGEGASNQQSQFCDICCRDHHDAGGGPTSYRPQAGDFAGDHPHFTRDNNGDLTEISAGEDYIEACRLVRKDGFFRVAQDFALQNLIAFPENFLDDTGEVDDYSAYVNSAVTDHFAGDPWPAHNLLFDGRDMANRSPLPTAAGSDEQQLRSRGVYTDLVTQTLQDNIDACFPLADRTPACVAPQTTVELEMYPFFDVQLTQLGRWFTNPLGDPVDVTNEDLANNGFNRGLASLAGSGVGGSTATTNIDSGNVGLLSTQSVTDQPPAIILASDLFIEAGGDSNPPPPDGSSVVSGVINAEGGTSDPAVATLTGSTGVNCTKLTNSTFQCIVAPDAVAPTLTVSNYFKNAQTQLLVCSDELVTDAVNFGSDAFTNWTRFILPFGDLSGVTLTIRKDSCA